MKRFFNSILNLGVDNSLSVLDRRRIRTVNVFNLIIALFLLIGTSNYFFIGSDYPVSAILVFLCLAGVSLYLSKLRQISWSFAVFTLNVNGAIFFINQYYPPETGPYLYYYIMIISVVLLNNPNAIDKFAVFHFFICAFFFCANLVLGEPSWRTKTLSPEMIKVLWYYNLVISCLTTAFLSVLLTRFISNQNKEIIYQNSDLVKTKEAVAASLKEKEVLLAELHHRVKNNLAIITGLLNLQEDATSSEEAKQVLGDSKARIMSMALVHRMLYENTDLKSIDLGKYSSELILELFNSYNLVKKVTLTCDCDTVILPVSKSVPLGLILNEIVTNSIKYAFRPNPKQTGDFFISIKNSGDSVTFIVKDNGPGFSKDLNTVTEHPSLGVYLIKTLTEQIEGDVLFSNEGGAKITLKFSPR